VFTTCYLTEARRYGFEANNEPNIGKCYLVAFNSDLAHENVIVRDLHGRSFPVVTEASTLGMTYGRVFQTASSVFRIRIASSMQGAMNQYKLVWLWQSTLSVAEKTTKMNAIVWNKDVGVSHLFPLSKSNRRLIDSAHARFLRRILKISAAYISSVSHVRVRQRCNVQIFHIFVTSAASLVRTYYPQT